MDGKDVEEIFNNVLSNESHVTLDGDTNNLHHESSVVATTSNGAFSLSNVNSPSSVVSSNPPQSVIIQQGPPPIMSPSHSGWYCVNFRVIIIAC